MRKKILFLLAITGFSISVQAQHVSFGPLHSIDSPREDWLLPGDTIYQDGKTWVYGGKPTQNTYTPLSQHITPQKQEDGYGLGKQDDGQEKQEGGYKWGKEKQEGGYGWEQQAGYGWGLHKGLNLSVDLSVFATFGKHAPHWGGFSQTINATYLTPLTKDNKLWMAVGAYVNNISYGGDALHDGGVYGILGYTNKNFSISVSFEGNWYNQKEPAYFKQYDYPVP